MKARVLAFGVAALAVMAAPALADHGKAGLWAVTVTVQGAPPPSPEAIAQMKANGIEVSGPNSMTVPRCMTQDEVSADKPIPMRQAEGCTMRNMQASGSTITAETVCQSPDVSGGGHFSMTYDPSNTRYSGQMTFSGVSHGHPVTMTNRFDAKWVRADCGNVGH
jgi:hypothetical protein